MTYKIVYRLDARLNVKEAKAWYKLQRNGLQKSKFQEKILNQNVTVFHKKKFCGYLGLDYWLPAI